jgi:hypothetical protein
MAGVADPRDAARPSATHTRRTLNYQLLGASEFRAVMCQGLGLRSVREYMPPPRKRLRQRKRRREVLCVQVGGCVHKRQPAPTDEHPPLARPGHLFSARSESSTLEIRCRGGPRRLVSASNPVGWNHRQRGAPWRLSTCPVFSTTLTLHLAVNKPPSRLPSPTPLRRSLLVIIQSTRQVLDHVPSCGAEHSPRNQSRFSAIFFPSSSTRFSSTARWHSRYTPPPHRRPCIPGSHPIPPPEIAGRWNGRSA